MAAKTTQVAPGVTGATLAFTAAAGGGDTVPLNNGMTLLIFTNAGGSPQTVTVDSELCSFGEEHDAPIVVGAGATKVAGPFDKARYGATLELTYSGVTSLTFAAVAPR